MRNLSTSRQFYIEIRFNLRPLRTYKMLNLLATFLMLVLISGFISSTLSHTWVEQICLLTSHDSFLAIGYPRGNGVTSDHFLILILAEHSL